MKNSLVKEIPENFMRQIVYCIVSAMEHVKSTLSKDSDTTTAIPDLIFDKTNEYIKRDIVNDKIKLINCRRGYRPIRIWLYSEINMTFNIMRANTLKNSKKTDRKSPYYVQTVVKKENSNLKSMQIQMDDVEVAHNDFRAKFDSDVIDTDYNTIFGENTEKAKTCKHCIIIYTSKNLELADISAVFYDKNFNICEEISLNEYIVPDFANLTDTDISTSSDSQYEENDTNYTELRKKPLVKIKQKDKSLNN